MTSLEMGPTGQRRGRGARERILRAAGELFREHGVNATGIEQVSESAQVSRRTVYQHFGGKDGLVEAYLQLHDAAPVPALERDGLTPRERLVAIFEDALDATPPLCPFIGAAVEIADPEHPARRIARDYKVDLAARLAAVARDAGAAEPEVLGDQLALLLDGVSARTRATGVDAMPTAVTVAHVLLDRALGPPT
ncbi:TetR/AcrR family transcriptional regulator [Nocardioides litoris]|uniref:TetR/AcrR family transcriptional regulator n=1 Tax=Nocardioides litoris TaxID=1926648 RepID=UPI00112206EE|nr:TetR/AcrR family transcriptional regulator [Nocardioides litoris]